MKRVTAALIIEKGKVLLTRRSPDEKNGGFWEFPGGKIEEGETEFDSLIRELKEELHLTIKPLKIFDEVHYKYAHGEILLIGIIAEIVSGQIELVVHDKYEWVSLDEVCNYSLSPADIPIAKKLPTLAQLP